MKTLLATGHIHEGEIELHIAGGYGYRVEKVGDAKILHPTRPQYSVKPLSDKPVGAA